MKLPWKTLLQCGLVLFACGLAHASTEPAVAIPALQAAALDGHAVSLPDDLGPVTLLIVGFTRGAARHANQWQKPARAELLPSGVPFYEIAFVENVPGFARGVASRMIRGGVPSVVKPHFLILHDSENEWKRAAGFDPEEPDAAYLLVVDQAGRVVWSTHDPFSRSSLERLKRRLRP